MTKIKSKKPNSVTVDEVDDEQLSQAATMLGTETPRDTVNQALREVVRRRMIEDYVALMKRASGTTYEDSRVEAWRSPTT